MPDVLFQQQEANTSGMLANTVHTERHFSVLAMLSQNPTISLLASVLLWRNGPLKRSLCLLSPSLWQQGLGGVSREELTEFVE